MGVGEEQAEGSSAVEGNTRSEVISMMSGAGHDAQAMSDVAPIGMLFVRCRGGVSHDPAEHVQPDDVALAAAALAHYLMVDS